jgi:hypothetical protein
MDGIGDRSIGGMDGIGCIDGMDCIDGKNVSWVTGL